jgi:DNA-binding MarR family transcriptional regulator
MAVKRAPEPSPPQPEPMIGALLRIPFQETVRRVHAHLVSAGFSDLRPAHLVVFQHLDARGTRQTELADRAQITKQSMGYLVDYLVNAGYMHRTPDPRDGRARLVVLTARGEAVVEAARRALSTLEEQWETLLGIERYAQVRCALSELTNHVERR